jgi:Virulence-associated protein E
MRDRNKANLTRKVDRARPAYAHYAVDAPRQWVGIATVNPGGYLNDPTGERRYWHVAATKYDRERFLADKDQLYAEAVAREPNENLWLDTPDLRKAHDEIVATVKEPNTLVDDLTDLAGEIWEPGRDKIETGWVIHREERVSNKQVRGRLGIIGIDAVRMRDIGTRISEAMMALGWVKGTLVCKRGGAPEGGYRRPLPDTYELVEVEDQETPGAESAAHANAKVIAFVKAAVRG